jgi:hypothetical protein
MAESRACFAPEELHQVVNAVDILCSLPFRKPPRQHTKMPIHNILAMIFGKEVDVKTCPIWGRVPTEKEVHELSRTKMWSRVRPKTDFLE